MKRLHRRTKQGIAILLVAGAGAIGSVPFLTHKGILVVVTLFTAFVCAVVWWTIPDERER